MTRTSQIFSRLALNAFASRAKWIAAAGLAGGLVFSFVGCAGSGSSSSGQATHASISAGGGANSLSAIGNAAVVAPTFQVNGARVGVVGQPLSLSLASPPSVTVEQVVWNFGDGSPVVTVDATASGASSSAGGASPATGASPAANASPTNAASPATSASASATSVNPATAAPVQHSYSTAGVYTLTVAISDSSGATHDLSYQLNVLASTDAMASCAAQVVLQVPDVASMGQASAMSVVIPACLSSHVLAVQWDFGDQSTLFIGSNATHSYALSGVYDVIVRVFSTSSSDSAYLTLNAPIEVVNPATASPVPTPTPTPLACPTVGGTRTSLSSSTTSQTVSCGVDGHQTSTYQTQTVEQCEVQNGQLLWVVVSTSQVLAQAGSCTGQSCVLSDGSHMPDQSTRAFYSSSLPSESCSSVAQSRVCNNGVLSGSSSFGQLTCASGCGSFGVSGTVQTGVVAGQSSVAVQCAFGETGIVNVFQQLNDQTCSDGAIVVSNARPGAELSAGACPVYQWAASGTWSSCSADCGGTQSELFNCVDQNGVVAPSARCSATAAMPVVTQVCDGNPQNVATVSATTTTESGSGMTLSCPAKQIGVVVQTRNVTTQTSYACVNHSVQAIGTTTTNGAWQTESYCRDYVAHRCSQDSLSTPEAESRYKWMMACKDKVPAIHDFLNEFANVAASGDDTISSGARRLYPTFMNADDAPESVWRAPTVATASCAAPAGVYVAAVCLSSCATPEQQIIVEAEDQLRDRLNDRDDSRHRWLSIPFLEAVQSNRKFVATLASVDRDDHGDHSPRTEGDLSVRAGDTARARHVQQWVSELFDTDHEVLNFHMRSGGSIRVTPNHALVSADGRVKLASEFIVGDQLLPVHLLKQDDSRMGQHDRGDEIVSIAPEHVFGQVYNVFVDSADPSENIVAINGYWAGTAFFQNEGARTLNRQLRRGRLLWRVFE